MKLLFNNLIRIIKDNVLLIFVLAVVLFVSAYAEGNDFDLTIGGGTDGGDLDIIQDGEDNNIDLDITSMDNFIISFSQTGNDHSIDIDVDGRTSDGSSIYITQTGNNRSYSGNLYCAHSFCTMTVTQP
tara:strand:+ start:94 stop:477 length:384 start_codon:yes stop_codon:yes gene_type:complete